MTHSIDLKEGIHIIRLEKLYTEYENKGILEEIEELILEEHNQFIIDLGLLKFVNSAGFNLMISVLTKSRNAGGETIIININEKIDTLLVMMKLKNVFQVCESEEAAIKFLTTEIKKNDSSNNEEIEKNNHSYNEQVETKNHSEKEEIKKTNISDKED